MLCLVILVQIRSARAHGEDLFVLSLVSSLRGSFVKLSLAQEPDVVYGLKSLEYCAVGVA